MINRIFIVLLTALFSLQLSAQCPQKRSCNQKPCKERCEKRCEKNCPNRKDCKQACPKTKACPKR